MDAITRHCAKLYLAGPCHGGGDGAALRCRDGVLLRPKFRFASRHLKVTDSGLLHLSSSKLRLPICSAASRSNVEVDVDVDTCEKIAEETLPSKTAQVRFLLKKECLFGEQFLLVGDHSLLGSWDPSSALPMNWSEGNMWILDTDIPIGKKIQFKFILRDDSTESENVEWQPDPNRSIEIWETGNAITVCEDWESASRQKIIEAETFIDFIEETLVEDVNLVPDIDAYTANGSTLDTTSMEVLSSPDVKITNPDLGIVAENTSDPIERLQFESYISATQNTAEEEDNVTTSEESVLAVALSEERPFSFEEEEESSKVDELEDIIAGPKEVEEELISKELKYHGVAEVNGVLKNDTEWGRKTLLGFLSNLILLVQ